MAERKRRSNRRATKDRVLQARIPEQLDEELRDRAEKLGLSVSTIVRNVLLHTFELVEGVVTDSAQVGRALQGRGTPTSTSPPELPGPNTAQTTNEIAVVGWQEAILNLNGICEKCNAILPAGERAAVGVPVQARPVLLCLECLEALSPQTREQDAQEKPATSPGGRNKKSAK
jgi:hypothetical protein